MRSDCSGGVRRIANRNYGGNSGRALIVARLATVRSGPDRGLFWRPFKKTGPYGPAPPDCSSVPKILDQTVQSGLFIT